MYFTYITNWVYRLMKIPVPLVVSEDIYGMVTVFDIFLFTVFLGVFFVLIKYLITDSFDLHVGDLNLNYSSNAYLPKNLKRFRRKTYKKESADNVDNS